MAKPNDDANNPAKQRGANLLSMVFHFQKTAALTNALLRDARVHWLPKIAFVVSIFALLLALLFPEVATDFIGTIGIGPIFDLLGVPAEAGIDIVAFGVAAFNLLKLFPADIVGEHYDELFRNGK